MMLIGLCGAAGSGKGSVASVMAGCGFVELAFADPLYAAVAAITGIPVERLKDRSVKEATIGWLGKSPRELLQLLGTEFGRGMIRDDIWVMRTMQAVDAIDADGCVITDVRFDNEAEAIRSRGGLIFEVVRPGHACLRGDASGHSSERGIAKEHILATIANSGTLADLDAAVRSLLADIMEEGRRSAPREGRDERETAPEHRGVGTPRR